MSSIIALAPFLALWFGIGFVIFFLIPMKFGTPVGELLERNPSQRNLTFLTGLFLTGKFVAGLSVPFIGWEGEIYIIFIDLGVIFLTVLYGISIYVNGNIKITQSAEIAILNADITREENRIEAREAIKKEMKQAEMEKLTNCIRMEMFKHPSLSMPLRW